MKRLLIWLVRGYQLLLSPWIGGQCRFTPTCSHYTLDALRQHGAARGSYLGVMRVVRCNPWCSGGLDPAPRVFRWAAWRRDESPDDLLDPPAQEIATAAGKPLKDTVTPPQV